MTADGPAPTPRKPNLLARLGRPFQAVLDTATGDMRRPQFDGSFESNVPGVYITGDLAGAPVIKLAMEQAVALIDRIAGKVDGRGEDPQVLDVLIAGAGAAGLNAALQCKENGLSYVVLEKQKIANTIENFPEGKWIYAEPDEVPPAGKLWLDGATKEDLLARWHQIVEDHKLNVRTQCGLKALARTNGHFTATTDEGDTLQARRIVLATGQRGNPRKLGVPGEDQEHVYHRLYSPKHYHDEDILVLGGGNSAVEAALTLCEQNRVTLSYRGEAFSRIFKDNDRKLRKAVEAGRLTVMYNSQVTAFAESEATLEIRVDGRTEAKTIPAQHAFVLIGAEPPVQFLKSLGVRMEGDWQGKPLAALGLTALWVALAWLTTWAAPSWLGWVKYPALAGLAAALGWLVVRAIRGDRYATFAVVAQIVYAVYAITKGLWPYYDWAATQAMAPFFHLREGAYSIQIGVAGFQRSGPFWYSLAYTVIMIVFGLQAMRRWGFARKDRFQIARYTSLILFQVFFFFLIPEFLFRWLQASQSWQGVFGDQAWRSYGIVYAWPLFFYTFFDSPHAIWVVWGVLLSFVVLPVVAVWHGKRYCSWVCGCGGLAETLGDRWRHLAPKGRRAVKAEHMNIVVLWAAVIVTALVVTNGLFGWVGGAAEAGAKGKHAYAVIVDIWLVAIIPVALYPFLGGKVWCRYWCPLAKLMELYSKSARKLGFGRYGIHANDKCIACGECTRYCLVGIPVMQFAMKQERLDNTNSSCIGCGICVTVCPMDVLSFKEPAPAETPP